MTFNESIIQDKGDEQLVLLQVRKNNELCWWGLIQMSKGSEEKKQV